MGETTLMQHGYIGITAAPSSPWCISLHAMILIVVALGRIAPVCGQRLAPIGAAVVPYYSNDVEQMVFDVAAQALYFADMSSQVVFVLNQTSSLPLAPLGAAPWNYTVVAGHLNQIANPFGIEVLPEVARFNSPTGLVGWPRSALMTQPPLSRAPSSFLGLWVVEYHNCAIRFINFMRGNNVTLVAGGYFGNGEGFGTSVGLMHPWQATWGMLSTQALMAEGRFTRSAFPPSLTSTLPKNIAVVLWTDEYGHCVRQGIPVDPTTMQLVSLVDQFPRMVFNVSTVIGACNVPGYNVEGLAYGMPCLFDPMGLTLVNPLPRLGFDVNSTNRIVFISDFGNGRLCLLTSLFPSSSRYLTEIARISRTFGVTVGRVQEGVDSQQGEVPIDGLDPNLYAAIEVYVCVSDWWNVSMMVLYNASTARIDVWKPSVMWSRVATVTARNMILFPYAALDGSVQGAMAVFSGTSNLPVQFYCCLAAMYSDAIDVGDGDTDQSRMTDTKSARNSVSGSPSHREVSQTHTAVPSRTLSAVWVTESWSTSSSTSRGSIRSATLRRGHQGWVTTRRAPQRSSRREIITATVLLRVPEHPRNGSFVSHATVDTLIAPVTSAAVGGSSIAGIATGVMSPGAASKGAVTGRLVSVWACTAGGPSEAAATDPQQFLNFGTSLGSGDDGGVARGALVCTTVPRFILFVGLAAVAHVKFSGLKPREAPNAFGVLVGVSLGYFTPNVIGLCTAVLASPATTATTMCAVGAAFIEVVMVAIIAAGVWRSGSSGAGVPSSMLQLLSTEFVDPLRRRRRWYYRIGGLEDVAAAALIAICSNIPRSSPTLCVQVAWVLCAITLLHLAYVAILRPYRKVLDTLTSIILACINASFGVLCCVVPRTEAGATIVSIGIQIVAASFYVMLVVAIGSSLWKIAREKTAGKR